MKLYKIMKLIDTTMHEVTTIQADSYGTTDTGRVVFYTHSKTDETTSGFWGTNTITKVNSIPLATFQLYPDYAVIEASAMVETKTPLNNTKLPKARRKNV